MTAEYKLTTIYRGQVTESFGIKTAISKAPIQTSIYLSFSGLAGDECADKRNHGGLDRALHQYPTEHYLYWQEKGYIKSKPQAAGMGENISAIGMTEENVYLGDRYQWGEAIIEVSQPRSPCFKLNKRWGIETLSAEMQEISRCGWLYRVIQPGTVSINAPLTLIARVPNAITIKTVCEMFFGDPLNHDNLLRLKAQQTLAKSWREKIIYRLTHNKVENWNFRLLGHA